MTIVFYDLIGSDPARPFSPHCWKVALALAHKGLDHRSQLTPYRDIPTVENGASKTLPVLRDGERVVADSFAIAEHLEDRYPNRPTLFGGPGGRAAARFVERWSQFTVLPMLFAAVALDVHDRLDPQDQAYFRSTREQRLGRSLEAAAEGREGSVDALRKAFDPLRDMLRYQPFMGGSSPLFADYIVAGGLQWVRVVSTFRFLDASDPVAEWFERCLRLHGGVLERVPAAT